MEHGYVCKRCGKEFLSSKGGRKYCSHECYAKRFDSVTKMCDVCGERFTVAYRFRGKKTCSKNCAKVLIARKLNTREVKKCLACGKDFEVVKSYKDKGKYCSYECFLSTRATRQPNVTLTCDFCGKQFIVSFVRRNQRFCSKSCANSGPNNPYYGCSGSAHPMHNRTPWNKGLTASTDDRVRTLGRKISIVTKQQFSQGIRSNVGERNPNYGNTSDRLTPEKRRNFSEAAIRRVLSGVSGYKTGHVTGYHVSSKGGNVRFKSSWELAMMMMWDTDSNVVKYEYEPFVIVVDDSSRAIPDFLVTFRSGEKHVVEIKPTVVQEIPIIHDRLVKIKEAVNKMGYQYVLFGNEWYEECSRMLGSRLSDAIEFHKNRG